MKKLTFLASLLLISAFVLAACGGANTSDATPGALATPDTGVGVVTEPVFPTEPVLPTEPVVMPTEAATLVVETPMAEATATLVTDTTPESNVPVAGDDDCNPNSVQGLLDFDVVDAEGNQIGDVDAVIVLRDTSVIGAPAVDNAAVTPMATDAAGTGTFVAGAAPQIAYIVIDLENEDTEAVVPFQAFDLTVRDRDVSGDTTGVVDATPVAGATAETPAAGAQDPVGDIANEFDVCAITLNNVRADALSELPMLDPDLDFTVDTWDEEYRAYWSGQGLVIPATGTSNLGAPALLDDEFNNVDARNPNNDDLGEVEDFIYNTQTGEVTYAILAAGGFLGLGETKVPVPMDRVQWLEDDPGDRDDAGYVVINISDDETWKNAPAFEDGMFDTTVAGWDDEIRAYWESITD